jgi:hypothetical protein
MVRRRAASGDQSLPAWVTSFSPTRYPASSFNAGWREWHREVRGFCDEEHLRSQDFGLWLRLISNVYAVKSEHWWANPPDGSSQKRLVTHLPDDLGTDGGAVRTDAAHDPDEIRCDEEARSNFPDGDFRPDDV